MFWHFLLSFPLFWWWTPTGAILAKVTVRLNFSMPDFFNIFMDIPDYSKLHMKTSFINLKKWKQGETHFLSYISFFLRNKDLRSLHKTGGWNPFSYIIARLWPRYKTDKLVLIIEKEWKIFNNTLEIQETTIERKWNSNAKRMRQRVRDTTKGHLCDKVK